MIDALSLNNVQLLLQKYFKGEDLYPTLIGGDENTRQSQTSMDKQKNFISMTAKLEGDIFKKGFSPYETYMSNDGFCGATSKEFDINNIGHRLYFNFEDDNVDFLTLFMFGCQQANIPFCFKFEKTAVRKDSAVVYIEHDMLEETIGVLKNIVEQHPEFAERRDLPMSCVHGGWFAYAPAVHGDGAKSYNSQFVDCVKNAFFDPELFNQYRHFFSLEAPLKDFANVLFEQVKAEYVMSGKPFCDIENNEDALRESFVNRSMLLALQFFSGSDKSDSGFVPPADENGVVDIHKPLMKIKSPISDFGVDVTPTAVLKSALQLIRRGGMKFICLSDDYEDFINAMSNNIRDELAKAGISVALPVELQGLAQYTITSKTTDCYAM